MKKNKQTVTYKIIFNYETKKTNTPFAATQFVERIVLCENEEVYRDRAEWRVYQQCNDPLKAIELGLFHQSYSTNDSGTERNNKISLLQVFWRKLFGK
ncbi:MAG: hypothetical protein LBU90_10375 [Bacteroidales bacterium]|jgi:hypothetical protein|nr:hypothetical protein [Bacteroidales bacterium]